MGERGKGIGVKNPWPCEGAGRDEASMLPPTPYEALPAALLSAVIIAYDIRRPSDLSGRLKTTELCMARQAIAHILRTRYLWTFDRIGIAMNTTHVGAMKRVQACEDTMSYSMAARRMYDEALASVTKL